jgi:hypothetical protein
MVADSLPSAHSQMSNAALFVCSTEHAEPRFAEDPWTTGILKVGAEPITQAIQWLAAQLHAESEARRALQLRVEALPSTMAFEAEHNLSDDIGDQVIDSGNLQHDVGRLTRKVDRLQAEFAYQTKKQEEQNKAAEGLVQLRFDAINQELQARALHADVEMHMNSVRSEVKSIAGLAAQSSIEAALASNTSNLHGKLAGVCEAVNEQLELLEGRCADLASQVDVNAEEFAAFRSACASNPGTSVTTPIRALFASDDSNSSPSHGIDADFAPKKPHLTEDNHGAGCASHAANSRRTSVGSTATTIGDLDSAQGRDTDSCFGRAGSPDEFAAWVEAQIGALRSEVTRLGSLPLQTGEVTVVENLQPGSDIKSDISSNETMQKSYGEHVTDREVTPPLSLHNSKGHIADAVIQTEKHFQTWSPMELNNEMYDQIHSFIEQRIQERLAEVHMHFEQEKSVPHGRSDPSNSSEMCMGSLAGDVGGSLNIESAEMGVFEANCSVAVADVIKLAKEELRTWLEEQRTQIIDEFRGTRLSHHKDEQRQPETGNNALCSRSLDGDVSNLRERLRAIENTMLRNAAVANPKEALKRLEQRVEALEQTDTRKQSQALSSSAGERSVQHPDADSNAMLREMQCRVGKVNGQAHPQVADAMREVANVSHAVKGTQKNLDMAMAKIEDLTSAHGSLNARIEVALPQFLHALRTIAQHVGLDNPEFSASSTHSASDTISPSLDVDALDELVNSNRIPKLFVSPTMLSQAIEALTVDLKAKLAEIQHDVRDTVRSKADAQEMNSLARKLGAMEQVQQDLPSWIARCGGYPAEESIENPAGVRWPLQQVRCISCNQKAQLVAPWEHKSVPKGPWPQRQLPLMDPNARNLCGSSPRMRGRRRDASLPVIERNTSNSKDH